VQGRDRGKERGPDLGQDLRREREPVSGQEQGLDSGREQNRERGLVRGRDQGEERSREQCRDRREVQSRDQGREPTQDRGEESPQGSPGRDATSDFGFWILDWRLAGIEGSRIVGLSGPCLTVQSSESRVQNSETRTRRTAKVAKDAVVRIRTDRSSGLRTEERANDHSVPAEFRSQRSE